VAAPTATVQGVIDCFRGRLLGGRRIGVQLFGDDGGDEILRFLRAKGAFVHEVAPYRYEPAANPDEVASFIEEIARDRYAAITFTTPMQVDRLFEVALRKGIETLLRVGLAGTQVVAVGRETRSALQSHDVPVDISPPRQFWMRHLVTALLARLGSSAPIAAPGVTQG
jgi:uroporphyrinogen-III synthase